MTNQETVSQAIHAIFGNLSDADIERITEAGLAIGRANMHYGLNSQVAANENKASIVRDVLDRMQAGTVDHIAKLIGSAHKHPHDRALIALGSDVLAILQAHEDWNSDTFQELSDSACNFGLVDDDDATDGFIAKRRDCFENPLNL